MAKLTKKMPQIEVTEVEGVTLPSDKRLYEFVVTECAGRDAGGFYVHARGPRGSTMATVFGDVTEETVVGARFWRY